MQERRGEQSHACGGKDQDRRVCVAICAGVRRGKDLDGEEPAESEDAEQRHEPGHDRGRDAARPQLPGVEAPLWDLSLCLTGMVMTCLPRSYLGALRRNSRP